MSHQSHNRRRGHHGPVLYRMEPQTLHQHTAETRADLPQWQQRLAGWRLPAVISICKSDILTTSTACGLSQDYKGAHKNTKS